MRRILVVLAGWMIGAGSMSVGGSPTLQAVDPPAKAAKLKEKLLEKRKFLPAQTAKPATPTPAARPATPAVKPLAQEQVTQKIDAIIDARLKQEGIPVSPRASDEEFLRRVSLDLTGAIPPVSQVRTFLDSRTTTKRTTLIDDCLNDPGFARRLADLWATKLFPKESDNRFISKETLHQYFEQAFRENRPWDAIVRQLIEGQGGLDEHPEVMFYLANRTIDKLTDAVGTHFLGQSVACAQCHNHPFNPMKQQEYWELAAFFSKVQIDRPRNPKMGGDNSKIGAREGFTISRQRDFFPEAAIKTKPKFPGQVDPGLSEREPYRPALATWVTSSSNPYFAKNMVNQTWALLFGQGLVEALDDLGDGSDASHPELLDFLAEQFIAHQFDLKWLYRTITLTAAYQRSSKPLPGNLKDGVLLSHQRIKVMMPEQLFDSLQRLNQSIQDKLPASAKAKMDAAKQSGKLSGPFRASYNQREQFVTFFLAGAEQANLAEYEAGIPQALRLMNNRQILVNNPNAFRAFVNPLQSPREAITELYLVALSRRPTETELKRAQDYLQENGRDGLGDLFWALTNSSEFVLIR